MIRVIGVMVRRNIIIIFMSIELILNAVNINLIAYSAQLQNVIGQVFAVFVIAVALPRRRSGSGSSWRSTGTRKPSTSTR
jgi:NADH-quinone oxidoreductase subunit K